MVAGASESGTVRLWDTSTGQLRQTLNWGHAGMWSVALSDDGGLLASGSADGSVGIWDTSTGACLRSLRADRHAGSLFQEIRHRG